MDLKPINKYMNFFTSLFSMSWADRLIFRVSRNGAVLGRPPIFRESPEMELSWADRLVFRESPEMELSWADRLV